MDKSYITFDVCSTSQTCVLGIEIFLDDRCCYNNDQFLNTETIKIEIPNDETNHLLKIILKNKTDKHTVIDHLGAIVQDSNIIVKKLKFNEVPVENLLPRLACYMHDTNGHAELKEYQFYGEMGCNGIVTLPFFTPVHEWLLENM